MMKFWLQSNKLPDMEYIMLIKPDDASIDTGGGTGCIQGDGGTAT